MLSLGLFGLAGCAQWSGDIGSVVSGSVKNAGSTIGYVFDQQDANRLSKEQLRQLPGSAVYAKLGDNPTATLILTVLEQQQGTILRYWQSGDEALITHNGRLTRSEGLPQDLRYTANLKADPLGCWLRTEPSAMPSTACTTRWHSQQDIELASGRVIRLTTVSEFELGPKQPVTTPLRGELNTQLLLENVTTSTGLQWQNRYWYLPSSGYVVKSKQQLGINDSPMSGTLTIEEARF